MAEPRRVMLRIEHHGAAAGQGVALDASRAYCFDRDHLVREATEEEARDEMQLWGAELAAGVSAAAKAKDEAAAVAVAAIAAVAAASGTTTVAVPDQAPSVVHDDAEDDKQDSLCISRQPKNEGAVLVKARFVAEFADCNPVNLRHNA